MKILVTGGTGFLGQKIIKKLSDHEVIALVRGEKQISGVRSIKLDGLKHELESNVDMVIHLATSYDKSSCMTAESIDSNLLLPLTIMKHILKNKNCRFINADTFFSTNHINKINNYIETKESVRYWLKQLKIQHINLYFHHMYGENDNALKFFSWLSREMESNEQINLTSGEQLRDFVYVGDAANALNYVINNFNIFKDVENIEIGTGKKRTLKNFILKLAELKGFDKKYLDFKPEDKDEFMDVFYKYPLIQGYGFGMDESLESGIKAWLRNES